MEIITTLVDKEKHTKKKSLSPDWNCSSAKYMHIDNRKKGERMKDFWKDTVGASIQR